MYIYIYIYIYIIICNMSLCIHYIIYVIYNVLCVVYISIIGYIILFSMLYRCKLIFCGENITTSTIKNSRCKYEYILLIGYYVVLVYSSKCNCLLLIPGSINIRSNISLQLAELLLIHVNVYMIHVNSLMLLYLWQILIYPDDA